jgi:AcrR family transcriptional regulator
MKTDIKNDRRTQKTKKYLAAALKELIVEKGYDAVTIQDIIDRANVGRSTVTVITKARNSCLSVTLIFSRH